MLLIKHNFCILQLKLGIGQGGLQRSLHRFTIKNLTKMWENFGTVNKPIQKNWDSFFGIYHRCMHYHQRQEITFPIKIFGCGVQSLDSQVYFSPDVIISLQKFLLEPFLQNFYILFFEILTSKQMVQVSLFSF